jgi:hypothetical protein
MTSKAPQAARRNISSAILQAIFQLGNERESQEDKERIVIDAVFTQMPSWDRYVRAVGRTAQDTLYDNTDLSHWLSWKNLISTYGITGLEFGQPLFACRLLGGAYSLIVYSSTCSISSLITSEALLARRTKPLDSIGFPKKWIPIRIDRVNS